ncbi:hypothetical protein RRG08_043191 [Elysia crispata]|uniref:Uncharacterized protein n=1 Tax=Elysia crispata TaxID=231223 RepID=A0AAE0ZIR3_9GAST|nr:hypothetical protein RRG08_043191 [Elysia crispata]
MEGEQKRCSGQSRQPLDWAGSDSASKPHGLTVLTMPDMTRGFTLPINKYNRCLQSQTPPRTFIAINRTKARWYSGDKRVLDWRKSSPRCSHC